MDSFSFSDAAGSITASVIGAVRARGFVCAVVKRCGCDTAILARELGTRLGLLAGDASIVRSEGRLVVLGQRGASVSVSHSGGRSVFAIAVKARVGVDLEHLRVLPASKLAYRYFHPEEAEQIAGAAEEDRAELFLRLWTMKEAQGKLLGEGLAGGALAWQVPTLRDIGRGARFASIHGNDWSVVRGVDEILALASSPGLGPLAPGDVRQLDLTHTCHRRHRGVEAFSR